MLDNILYIVDPLIFFLVFDYFFVYVFFLFHIWLSVLSLLIGAYASLNTDQLRTDTMSSPITRLLYMDGNYKGVS